MKESTKLIIFALVVCCAFVAMRVVETVHIFSFTSTTQASQDAAKSVAASFEVYRDFVVIVTGIFALMFGAIGFLAYSTYKNLRDEQTDIIKKLEDEMKKISKLRADYEKKYEEDRKKNDGMLHKLEMHEKIQMARFILGSEVDKTPAIEILKQAEALCTDSHVLYQMKGDALYYRGQRGDYARAIVEYNKAKEIKDDSPDIWFGISQSKFKSSSSEQCDASAPTLLRLNDYQRFKLIKNHFDAISRSEVEEAIKDMERANSCGLGSAQAELELGHMYKSIGENHKALKMYKSAYYSNAKLTVSGFFYCHLWIMNNIENFPHIDASDNELTEVVDILKSVGLFDLYNWKEAYALLWYLYKVVLNLGTADEIESALHSTNRYIISKLFKLVDSADSACSGATPQSSSPSSS